MKTLILTLIFSTTVLATTTEPEMQRLSDSEISNKLISVARDVENEKLLSGIPELQRCGQLLQRNPNDTAGLERCVKEQVGTNAANISDQLNLETYQLISSKNVQNVTKYVTNKLYKNLTGVDREEEDNQKLIQSMKFNTKKQIDHKIFYDLYKSQIAKNALFEVSRFCFVDFRLVTAPTGSTFSEHWTNLSLFTSANPTTGPNNDPLQVTDSGVPSFAVQGSSSDPKDAYENIMAKIFNSGNAPTNEQLKNFFMFCGRKIQELCKSYEENTNRTAATPGSKACVAKTRLTAFRKALKDTEKVAEAFNTREGKDIFLRLDGDAIVKRYTGTGGEKTLNDLTNSASADYFKATERDGTEGAQDCIDAEGSGSACDNFSIVDNSAARIEQSTNLVYMAKREAEMKRVSQLVRARDQNFRKYIEENYPDLIGEVDRKTPEEWEELIRNRWEARRLSLINEIKNRIGDRQVPGAPATASTTGTPAPAPKSPEQAAKENAQDALSERARLAQMVFFNNIISSSLELEDSNNNSLGRNRMALSNELDTAEAEVQPGLFRNLRSLAEDSSGSPGGGIQANQNVSDIKFLDDFIGIPRDENRAPGSSGD